MRHQSLIRRNRLLVRNRKLFADTEEFDAKAYSTDICRCTEQSLRFSHIYIDAFAGAGMHLSRTSGEFVLGSPLNALACTAYPFVSDHLIDIDRGES